MARLPVLRMGNPVLRRRSNEVSVAEIQSHEMRLFLSDLVDTMRAEQGVGIAAPQVGVLKRICVIEFQGDNSRYPGLEKVTGQSLTTFINPSIEVIDPQTQEYWEGCLSVPGLRGLVKRPREIRVKFLDENAQAHEWVAKDFLAIVLQHEFDHLDGKLYVDRVEDNRQLAFVEEFRQFILPQSPSTTSIESEDHE